MHDQHTASHALLAPAAAWCSSPEGTQVLGKAEQLISQLDNTEEKPAQLALQLTAWQQTIQAGVHELAMIRQTCPLQAVSHADLDTIEANSIEADTIQADHSQEVSVLASQQHPPAVPVVSLGTYEHMNDVTQPAKLGISEQQTQPKPEPALKTEAPALVDEPSFSLTITPTGPSNTPDLRQQGMPCSPSSRCVQQQTGQPASSDTGVKVDPVQAGDGIQAQAPAAESASSRVWDILHRLGLQQLCTRCWRSGHSRRLCWLEDPDQPHLFFCGHCGGPGHAAANCFYLDKPKQNKLDRPKRAHLLCGLCCACAHTTDCCFLIDPWRAPQLQRFRIIKDHETLCELGVLVKCGTGYQPAPPKELQRIRREIDGDSAHQEHEKADDVATDANKRTRSHSGSRSRSRDGTRHSGKEHRPDSKKGRLEQPDACRASGQGSRDYPEAASKGRVCSRSREDLRAVRVHNHSRDSSKAANSGRVRSRSRDSPKAASRGRVRSRSRDSGACRDQITGHARSRSRTPSRSRKLKRSCSPCKYFRDHEKPPSFCYQVPNSHTHDVLRKGPDQADEDTGTREPATQQVRTSKPPSMPYPAPAPAPAPEHTFSPGHTQASKVSIYDQLLHINYHTGLFRGCPCVRLAFQVLSENREPGRLPYGHKKGVLGQALRNANPDAYNSWGRMCGLCPVLLGTGFVKLVPAPVDCTDRQPWLQLQVNMIQERFDAVGR